MTHDSQREQSIERLLRHGAGRAPQPGDGAACLDGETLAAWSSGALPSVEAARVEGHLADCLRCQSMVAALVRTDPPAPAPAERWWSVRWLVPLATAATVAAIWVAIPDRSPSGPEPSPGIAQRAAPEAEPPTPAPAASPAPEPTPRDTRAAKQPDAPIARRDDSSQATPRAPLADAAPEAPPPLPSAVAERRGVGTQPPAERPAREERMAASAPQAMARFKAASAVVEIRSPDDPARWRFAAGAPLERSADGGATWQRIDLPAPADLIAGHSPGGTVAWLVGRAGAIYVTTDGQRFERVPFAVAVDLTNVVAIDNRQATVTAADGRSFTTTTRGGSWK